MPYRRKPKSLVTKLVKDVRKLKRETMPEKKHLITSVTTAASATYAGSVIALSEIGPGDYYYQRAGNVVNYCANHLRISVYPNASLPSVTLRVILFKVNSMAADAVPSPNDFMFQTSNYCAAISTLKPTDKQRYTIIADQVKTLGNQSSNLLFDIKRKLHGKAYFNGSATSDIDKGALFVYICSDSVSLHPQYVLENDLTFCDP